MKATNKRNKKQKRYSAKELEEFKIIINNKLTAARQEVSQLKQELMEYSESRDTEISYSFEDGSESNVREHYANMIARQNKFIENLESALNRISNGSYGICRATGELIEKNRLRAVPHATLSIKAKKQMN